MNSFKQDAKIKGIDLILDIDSHESLVNTEHTDEILSDESKLNLIIYNIVSNSLRYSQKGVVKVKCRLLTIEEAKRKIERYLRKGIANEQAESLRGYKLQIHSNYDT